ncbi:MAG TPA: wax ester/triacylglycerol synthase family O-acyltransferase [Acidimicrobiales bacterium]|nr:wax ester/triacylglycerol synthase family O-acyltransferase [Acidimicrobiales bacterium]
MQRLPGFDAAFLALESATNHMHVASLLIVDPAGVSGGWTADRVRDVVRDRLPAVPPFRRRLVPVPFGINHPLWADVPDPDLSFHIRRAAVPRPGGPQELADVVADLMGRALDRSRPLWELHVIEGLARGLAAVMIKAHHSALDGVSGSELLVRLLDESAEPRPPERQAAGGEEPGDSVTGDTVSEAQLIGAAVAGLPGTERLMAAVQRTLATVAGLRHRNSTSEDPPPPSPFTAPRTSLNVRIGPWRRVAWVRLALGDVKKVTSALGGTVNDVVLALCSIALDSYFADHDEKPDGDLVALVPLSARAGREQAGLGNRISPMLVSLASGVEAAGDRLRAISAGIAQARAQDRVVQRDLLAGWADLVVPALAVPVARLGSRLLVGGALAPAFNLIVSNVPGPKAPLFLAGARVLELYPLGPVLDGAGLNITVMTYGDYIHVGVVADRDAVPDAGRITAGMEAALNELLGEIEGPGRR